MQSFNYHRPQNLADAVAALKASEEGKALAGGQSFIPVMKLDLAAPTDVVNLSDVAEMKGISVDGDTVTIGALSTHMEVHESATVKAHIPSLSILADGIGDAQVRNRGTLGGAVAHADPRADYPAALVALKAVVKTDRREIPAADFFEGLFETPLEEDELIVSVTFTKPEKGYYGKFASPASKYAVAGVFVAKHADGVIVAVTGAANTVFRVPEMEAALGTSFTPEALDGISVSAEGLNTDIDGTPEYRAHLVSVMAKRAVAAAV